MSLIGSAADKIEAAYNTMAYPYGSSKKVLSELINEIEKQMLEKFTARWIGKEHIKAVFREIREE